MIIDSTVIGMESARTYSSISKDAQFLTTGGGPKAISFLDTLPVVNVTEKSNDLQETVPLDRVLESMKAESSKRISVMQENDLRQKLHDQTLMYLLRLIYGENWAEKCSPDAVEDVSSNSVSGAVTQPVSMVSCRIDYESETTVFSTVGTVNTSDGRSIAFNVEALMSREFMDCSGLSVRQDVLLTDPLVINIDAPTVQVSDQKFMFDIDSDGTEEEISQLGPGSGFIALDRNGDGIINNGKELFGTESGNGFADLAVYDLDSNGWIDEADDIFDKLKIWSLDETGKSTLVDLKSAGIGAIYLGNSSTEFSLKNTANATEAVIRSSGIFLFEDGRAGTVQQVDMAG